MSSQIFSCYDRRMYHGREVKLFTAVMEEVFKKADISEGINVDGENLTT